MIKLSFNYTLWLILGLCFCFVCYNRDASNSKASGMLNTCLLNICSYDHLVSLMGVDININ